MSSDIYWSLRSRGHVVGGCANGVHPFVRHFMSHGSAVASVRQPLVAVAHGHAHYFIKQLTLQFSKFFPY